jgi:hypothetical protein
MGRVGPLGLKREGRSSELKQFQHLEPFCTGGTPVPQCGFRKRLSVYPLHQPRRGGITPAGAARPRNSKERNFPPIPTGGCRHRQGKCRPSGPKEGRESLNQEVASYNHNPSNRRFRTGGTPMTRCGSRKRLSVYPLHQPRRGGITPAGAARPRGSKERNSLLYQPVTVAYRAQQRP